MAWFGRSNEADRGSLIERRYSPGKEKPELLTRGDDASFLAGPFLLIRRITSIFLSAIAKINLLESTLGARSGRTQYLGAKELLSSAARAMSWRRVPMFGLVSASFVRGIFVSGAKASR